MKKLMLVSLATIMSLSTATLGQNQKTPKATTISGTVSLDGHTLVADNDNTWTISNAEVVKGREGRHVTIKCKLDSGNHAIYVLLITQQDRSMKEAVYHGDSAFRR
jgi:hypothetical protein